MLKDAAANDIFSILKNDSKVFNQLPSKFCGQLLGSVLQQSRKPEPCLHIWVLAMHTKPYWEWACLMEAKLLSKQGRLYLALLFLYNPVEIHVTQLIK